MEHSEQSAVWNPAHRSEDLENESSVAPSIKEDTAVAEPSLPTPQETVPESSDSSKAESTAPVETEEAPAASDEHTTQPETRQEFHEEAAELLSAAGGENKEANPFDPEAAAEDDGIASTQDENGPKLQTQPIDQEASDNNVSSNQYPDAGWEDHQESTDYSQPVNGEISSTNHDLWGSPKSVDNGEDNFFDQLKTQTKPIYFPPEESRYEEGLPLLDDALETPVEPTAPQQSQLDTVFDGDENEDEGFFSSTQKPEAAAEPEGSFHIHRKSTSQAMDDSLGTSQPVLASPLSPTAEEFGDILAAAATKSPGKAKEPSSEQDLAAAWQAELSDDDMDVAPVEEDLAAKWQAELDDDEDLLLEEETSGALQDTSGMVNGDAADHASQGLGSPFGTPQSAGKPRPSQSAYTPHQPSTADLIGVPAAGAAPLATSAPYSANYFPPRPEPRAPMVRAESFAEQSKQGYKSPYDLPEDLAPRRRPATKPVVASAPVQPTPPPRSSSIPVPPPPQASSTVPTPPIGGATSSPTGSSAAPAAAPAQKNFYEELPLPPARARSRPANPGRYAPNPNNTSPSFTQPPPPAQADIHPQPHISGDTSHAQVQQPERLESYANSLAPSSQTPPAVPSASSRYSPKPPTLQPGTKPPASSRYSPAPPPSTAPPPPQRYASQPSSAPGQGAPLPFQPRTSSPLAHHEKVSYQPNDAPRKPSLPQPTSPVDIQPPHIDGGGPNSPPSSYLHPAAGPTAGQATSAPSAYQPSSPPRNPYAPPSYIEEFSRRATHGTNAPSPYTPPPESSPFVPPRRSQTQSPTQQQSAPRLSVPSVDPLKRPASVHAPSSPTKATNAYAPARSSSHTRTVSMSLDFIPPSDGQELDALQRWKGAPIFKFGFGGTVLSCFPKHIPRYSAGQTAPKIKSMPGETKTAQLHDVVPFPESIVQHPGPLRSKSKKKDLVAWLSSKIAAFENEGVPLNLQAYPDSHKRHEERILLWKVVRVLVEHDGGTQTSPELQTSLRSAIFPHLQNNGSGNVYNSSVQSFGAQPLDAASHSDAANSKPLGSIHDNLLLGEREKAVWSAADNRLWGHAMIIASTLEKPIWKQVIQEFVRREVRSSGGHAESLAALYEIFAGNFEESIDELVPPSARAGLQMVSKVDGQGASKDALAGLESWKDTLGLVLNNRSPDDHQALLALGRLLLSYGRVEAAHICLLFSRTAVFGGPDDRHASIALLGIDHVHSSPSALLDDDAILLTEAYEYATSVLAGAPTSTLPHLLAFKLLHAWSLTDQGHKTEAQHYCDAIAAALKATTKPTGYHNQHLLFGVDELSARLKQTTGDGSSWISKPSMEKVSSSMWNRFSNFVAGDDSDAASTGSGKGAEAEVGPFAKMAGTPTVSRSPSATDLYSQYPAPAAQPIPASGPSRYQPNSQYASNSSPDQGRGRSSLDSQKSASFGPSYGQRRDSQEYAPQSENPMYSSGPFYSSPSAGYQSTPPQPSYMPLAPVEEDMGPQASPPTDAPQGLFAPASPYQPSVNTFDQSFGADTASRLQSNEPDGYMPPENSGYEPPSTGTGPALEVTDESDDEKSRKKSAMDDNEDDIAARAEDLKKAEKARKDQEADEAFRKAAEADGKPCHPYFLHSVANLKQLKKLPQPKAHGGAGSKAKRKRRKMLLESPFARSLERRARSTLIKT